MPIQASEVGSLVGPDGIGQDCGEGSLISNLFDGFHRDSGALHQPRCLKSARGFHQAFPMHSTFCNKYTEKLLQAFRPRPIKHKSHNLIGSLKAIEQVVSHQRLANLPKPKRLLLPQVVPRR